MFKCDEPSLLVRDKNKSCEYDLDSYEYVLKSYSHDFRTYSCTPKSYSRIFKTYFFVISLFFSLSFLATPAFAVADSSIDRVSVKIPISCTLSGTGNTSHTASIPNGTYNSSIGETTLKAYCNDGNGFAIYAIGYTNDEDGNNVLTNASLGSSYDILTGTATGPVNNVDSSQWAMKLSTVSSPTPTYPITIQNSFDSFHTVPTDYTLVAKRTSSTDSGINAEGSTLKTTYQTYISKTQAAGTYTGKVKYVLVHPHSTPTPYSTMLDTGKTVAAKMKTLAAGTTIAYNAKTSDIKAVRMADSLPSGFTPSDANTVSDPDLSKYPIYIFFDNTNDAGIMYFYSGGYQVVMNPDCHSLFRGNLALSDISGLETWDSSQVSIFAGSFIDTPELTNVNALRNWDTSNVTDMDHLFAINQSTYNSGYRSNLSDISGLANWDTSNVDSFQSIFSRCDSLTNLDALTHWDTSEAEDLSYAFYQNTSLTDISGVFDWDLSSAETISTIFGNNASLTSISGLELWDVSGVKDFSNAFWGTYLLTDFSAISGWNVSSAEDMSGMFGMGPGESKTGHPVIDLTPFTGWNVANVTDMAMLFQNVNIESFYPLRNWNVGRVEDFSNAFNQTLHSTTTTLTGLENWNVSSAKNVAMMFAHSVSLTDASAINGWNITGVIPSTGEETDSEGFNRMFYRSPVHPTFTLRSGTWNSEGTFTPSS